MTPQTADQIRDFRLEQDLALLVPIAQELADKADHRGVSVEDVRVTAEARMLLFAYSDRAYLSRLFGAVMSRAGLQPTGQYTRTTRLKKRGGNLVSLWRRAA